MFQGLKCDLLHKFYTGIEHAGWFQFQDGRNLLWFEKIMDIIKDMESRIAGALIFRGYGIRGVVPCDLTFEH